MTRVIAVLIFMSQCYMSEAQLLYYACTADTQCNAASGICGTGAVCTAAKCFASGKGYCSPCSSALNQYWTGSACNTTYPDGITNRQYASPIQGLPFACPSPFYCTNGSYYSCIVGHACPSGILTRCPLGAGSNNPSYSAADIRFCTNCSNIPANGQYINVPSTYTACSWGCNAGYYKSGSICQSCPSNNYCLIFSTSPTACPDNGTSPLASVSASNCSCKLGTFADYTPSPTVLIIDNQNIRLLNSTRYVSTYPSTSPFSYWMRMSNVIADTLYMGSNQLARFNYKTGINTPLTNTGTFTPGVGMLAKTNNVYDGVLNNAETFLYFTSIPFIGKFEISTSTVTMIAGRTLVGCNDGVAGNAQFGGGMLKMIINKANTKLYVVDSTCNTIRLIDIATQNVTTFAGNGQSTDSDGIGTGTALTARSIAFSNDESSMFILTLATGFAYRLKQMSMSTLRITTIQTVQFDNSANPIINIIPSRLSPNSIYMPFTSAATSSTFNKFGFVTPIANSTTIISGINNRYTMTDGQGPNASFSTILGFILLNETLSSTSKCIACPQCSNSSYLICNATYAACVSCTQCGIGTYQATACSGTKDNVCAPCPTGTYCVSIIPTPCPPGTYCPNNGTSSPTPCPVGSFCPNNGTTTPTRCQPTSYCPYTGLSASIPCPAGSFCDALGMSNSTPCTAGQFNPSTGRSTCQVCDSGTYCPSINTTVPTPCPLGASCPDLGMSVPIPCRNGTYNSATGRTSCTPCAAGTYNPTTNRSACLVCGVGTFMNATGSATPCLACPIGVACSATGTGACAPLPSNAFFTGYGLSYASCPYACASGFYGVACLQCPANSFCFNSTRTACPTGTVSAPQSTTYLQCACAPGTYGNVTGSMLATCVPCPLNAYCPASPMTCGCS